INVNHWTAGGTAQDETLKPHMPDAVDAQHIIAKTHRDNERQFARVGRPSIRAVTQAGQSVVGEADVDTPSLAVEPKPRAAVDAGVGRLLLADPQLVGRTQVGRCAVAVKGHHGIRKVAQSDRSLVFETPHWLPGSWEELMRHLAV